MADKIAMMTSAKHSLERVLLKNRDAGYANIVSIIDNYIQTNCSHTIVRDLIDIDLERSQTIFYCQQCYTEFLDCQGTPKKISSHSK